MIIFPGLRFDQDVLIQIMVDSQGILILDKQCESEGEWRIMRKREFEKLSGLSGNINRNTFRRIRYTGFRPQSEERREILSQEKGRLFQMQPDYPISTGGNFQFQSLFIGCFSYTVDKLREIFFSISHKSKSVRR